MTTFSQLIDNVLLETSRLDLLPHAISYLRQTIRECHLDPERNTAIFLWPNYAEDQVTADEESAYSWPIPDTTRFQGLQMVKYDSVFEDGYNVYALPMVPGRAGNDQRRVYQQVGDQVIFRGYGGVGGIISLAYFEYPRSLKYYAEALRPATWDEESGYTYLPAYDLDDDTREAARGLTVNWLLERWDMVLEEGLRAKLYKRLSDTERARTCYSLYMSLRLGLQNSEQADLAGVR
jgi:hypothetical protein